MTRRVPSKHSLLSRSVEGGGIRNPKLLDPYIGVSFCHDPLKKDSEEDPSAVEVRFIKRVIQRMVKTGRVQNPVKQSKTVNNKTGSGNTGNQTRCDNNNDTHRTWNKQGFKYRNKLDDNERQLETDNKHLCNHTDWNCGKGSSCE